MARPLRLEFVGALYHITSRGDRREDIYENDRDRESFLSLLEKVCETYNWVCHAYCLMSNHYHLLIETPDANLSRGMRQLNGVYTQTFNRAHGRVGHVFQGRYRAILVEKESYLLELSRYIVLNPVRAGMVPLAKDWPQLLVDGEKELSEIPSSQRRPTPEALSEYETSSQDRNSAICRAYQSGGYTLKEIGNYFGLHYSSVSGIIKNHKSKT